MPQSVLFHSNSAQSTFVNSCAKPPGAPCAARANMSHQKPCVNMPMAPRNHLPALQPIAGSPWAMRRLPDASNPLDNRLKPGSAVLPVRWVRWTFGWHYT
jgi:hypothetical protein